MHAGRVCPVESPVYGEGIGTRAQDKEATRCRTLRQGQGQGHQGQGQGHQGQG